MHNPLQHTWSYFLRCCLHVPPSTPHWIAVLEAGEMPLQFYWQRRTATFYNGLCASTSVVIRTCMAAQRTLLDSGQSSWLSNVSRSFQVALPGACSQSTGVDVAALQRGYAREYAATLWDIHRAPLPAPGLGGRKLHTYLTCMWDWDRQFSGRPAYHDDPHIKWKVRRVLILFRTINTCPVNTMLRLPRDERRCDDCGAPAADEEHVMLRCRGFATDDRRSDWEDTFDFTQSFAAFMNQPGKSAEISNFIYCMLVHINLGRDATPHYLPANALCNGGGVSAYHDATEVFPVSEDLSDDSDGGGEFVDFV